MVGSSSDPQSVTVTNTGTGQLVFPANAVGISGDGFAVTADSCTATTVAAGGTCTVKVRFSPAAPGDVAGSVQFISTAPGSPHAVALSGTGTTAPPPPVVKKKKQTLAPGLPKRIKRAGLTVLTPKNARTNAGQRVRTKVRGGAIKTTAAGEVRYFTVIRGPKGKVSIRTYGYRNLKFKVTQKAPSTKEYKRFTRTATYLKGRRG
jgi:hypothetical protein